VTIFYQPQKVLFCHLILIYQYQCLFLEYKFDFRYRTKFGTTLSGQSQRLKKWKVIYFLTRENCLSETRKFCGAVFLLTNLI